MLWGLHYKTFFFWNLSKIIPVVFCSVSFNGLFLPPSGLKECYFPSLSLPFLLPILMYHSQPPSLNQVCHSVILPCFQTVEGRQVIGQEQRKFLPLHTSIGSLDNLSYPNPFPPCPLLVEGLIPPSVPPQFISCCIVCQLPWDSQSRRGRYKSLDFALLLSLTPSSACRCRKPLP